MHITISDINNVSSADIEKWLNEASSEKQEEFSRIKVESKRNERIVADHLKRTAIADYCNVAPECIEFGVTEKGKPFAMNLPVHFNISHSNGLVVCAVSNNEIGIDIEKIRTVNPRTAKKFACPDELEYIGTHENGFFEIWTLKEAYFKCIGSGLGSDIKNVCFKINENGIICSAEGYVFSFVDIKDGYICSICTKIPAR